jgi:carboxypeptidase T
MRRLVPLVLALVLFSAYGYTATFQSIGFYQSFDQMTSWAEQFAADNSDLVNLVEYGRSYQNRPLLALQITRQPGINDPSKPEFLFTGGIHAREVITSQAMYQLAERLVNGYRSQDPEFLDILSEREVWIVPNMNPDGRIVVEGGGSTQRKNLQGVDLNRNFPHRWNQASTAYLGQEYRGPSILSTPEDSALWAMVHDPSKFNDLFGAIDFHSGENLIVSPWTSPTESNDYPLAAQDREKFDALASGMSQHSSFPIGRLAYNSYGTLADSLYEDSLGKEFRTYSFSEEIFVGTLSDYFTLFNPVDLATRDDRVNRAINSALYLLSDDAFLLVPEPAEYMLFASLCAAILTWRKRCQEPLMNSA